MASSLANLSSYVSKNPPSQLTLFALRHRLSRYHLLQMGWM